MADIKLIKPQAGERTTLESTAGARLEFAFSTADAVLEKNGNDLVFTFADGASIALTDFYTAYSKETLPEFVVEGQTIAGSEFFAALGNDDLMPAAGPAAAQAATGGRFHEYDEAGLMGGIDRLDGLDLSWQQGGVEDRLLAGDTGVNTDLTGLTGLTDPADPVDPTDPADPVDPSGPVDPEIPEINEAPQLDITVPPPLDVTEAGVENGNTKVEGSPVASGKVNATDPEGDALNFYFLLDASGNKVSSVTTPYGTITIDSDGNYTYVLNNDGAANNLPAGDSHSESFTVGVSDSHGNDTGQTLAFDVTINGTNDQPTLALSQTQLTVTDKSTITDSGDARGTDVDDGAQLTYSFTDGQGNNLGNTITDGYGTLTMGPDGAYSYALDSKSLDVKQLAEDESITQTRTIRVQDEHGAWSEQEITVVITGSNDLPTVDMSHLDVTLKESGVKGDGIPANTAEIGISSVTGQVKADDADAKDSLTFEVAATPVDGDNTHVVSSSTAGNAQTITTDYGTLVLNTATGAYKYTLNENTLVHDKSETYKDPTATNSLSAGETRTENFTVTVSDGHGGTVEQTITVTIEGTNDRPLIEVSQNNFEIAEPVGNEDVSVSGTFEVFDVDSDAGSKQTYSLFAGKDTSGTATNGHNEAGTDKDQAATFTTAYGTLTVDPATGTYTYVVDADSSFVQGLGKGESHTETFWVRVTDEHGATSDKPLTFTINGTNDLPVVEQGSTSIIIAEDNGAAHVANEGTLTSDGKIVAADVDGDTLRYNLMEGDGNLRQTLEGQDGGKYGYLTLNPATGDYVYTLFNDSDAVQSLSAGETVNESFKVRVSDGKGGFTYEDISVTISGANDKPILTGNVAGVVEDSGDAAVPDGAEGKAPTTSGKLDIHDVDTKDEKSFKLTGSQADGKTVTTDADGNMTIEGLYGTLTLNLDGTYTYILTYTGEDLQGKNAGELFGEEKFDVTWKSGTDSEKTHITIGITGSNDKPLLTTEGANNADEVSKYNVQDKNCAESGTIKATDIDDPDTSLSFRFMNEYDAHGKPVNGKDFTDTSGKEPALGEGANHWEAEQSSQGEYGAITINPDGSYSYTLNIFDSAAMDAYFKANPDAKSISETFTVTVTDKHGATDTKEITVSVPTKDIPGYGDGQGGAKPHDDKITVDEVRTTDVATQEDGTLNHSGKVTIDLGCKHDNHGSEPGQGAGHDKGHGGDKGNFLFAFKDAEGNFVTTISDVFGSITINPITGDYVYTLNNDSTYVQELNGGEMLKPTIPVSVVTQDKDGTWIEAGNGSIAVSITGKNDAPIIGAAPDLNIAEDGASISGSVKAHDVDNGGEKPDAVSYEFTYDNTPIGENGAESPYGTLNVDANGKYTFTLDPSKTQSLGVGDHAEVTFTVTVKDQNGDAVSKDITVTIDGTNDAPTLEFVNVGDNTLDFIEDSTTTLTGQVKGSDVDAGDAADLRYSMSNADGKSSSYILQGEHGTMLLDPKTGKYEYRLDSDSVSVQKLGVGEIATETYTITVSDGHGGTAQESITVTVTGENDLPELRVTKAELSVTEDGRGMAVGTAIAFGKATATDVDANDTLDYGLKAGTGDASYEKNADDSVSVQGQYGILTIAANGTYTYTPTDAIGALGKGAHGEDTFTIFVDDHKGGVVEQEVMVNVTGTNDAPVVNVDKSTTQHELVETDNGFPVLNGKLVVDDPDADTLTYSIGDADKAAAGIVTLNDDGSYTYTLNEGYQPQAGQQDSFTVTINDGNGGEITQDITIDISPKAEEPEISEQHEQVAAISLFMSAGDESLYDGLGTDADAVVHPMGFSGSAAYGTEDVAGFEPSGTLLAFLAELFPQDTGEDMDALLMNSLSDINAAPLAADMTAQAASAEVSFTPEVVDMPASVTPADGMAEATDMAAHKIMLENNG